MITYWMAPGLKYKLFEYTYNRFLEDFCKVSNVELGQLTTKRKHRLIAQKRQIAMVLLLKNFKLEKVFVAGLFNRTHATVIHAEKVVEDICSIDLNFKREYEKIALSIQRISGQTINY